MLAAGLHWAIQVCASVAIGMMAFIVGQLVWHPSSSLVGIAALGCCVVGWRGDLLRLPSSRWRVPQGWARAGYLAYATAFGWVLGMGLLTAAASVGYYALLAYAWTARSWFGVVVVFASFGLARGIPLGLAVWRGRTSRSGPYDIVQATSSLIKRLWPIEWALLLVVGASFLFHGR